MKKNLKNWAGPAFAILAAAAWCGTARADLGPEISVVNNFTSWNNDPHGNAPFYEADSLSGTQTATAQPVATSNAVGIIPSFTVLSETFSIANGAGVSPAQLNATTGNTNYTLTGLGLLVSGATTSTNPLYIHLFDITANVVGTLTSSSATYNFTNPPSGDLLGGGAGLLWSNNSGSGEQQVYLPLFNGPNSYDQVVLGAGHIYALEIWTPTNPASELSWYRATTGPDAGGQAMGIGNGSPANPRETLDVLHDPATPIQKMFAMALYGYITSTSNTVTASTISTNSNTNVFPTTINYIVDAFNAFGYGPVNPYVGTTNYSIPNQFAELWTNWYGSAWVTNLWDDTTDASGNAPNSGSLAIVADYSAATGTQYLAGDYPQGITPPLNGFALGITNFQCDVLFSNGSAITLNGTVTNYGHLQFGMATSPGFSGSPDTFGSVEVPIGTTNWTHVSFALNPDLDANLNSINNVIIKIDGNWYSTHALGGSGSWISPSNSMLWVDNIKFVGPAAPPPAPPAPTLYAQKAVPELRIFGASTINTYDREELDTVDQNQSWIYNGVQYPVTYSFTLLDFPVAPGMQCHVFLVPVNTLPPGNTPTNNEYVDYQTSNNVWLDIAGRGANSNGSSGYSLSLLWKTNTPNANAANEALTGGVYTNTGNQSPVGTWTLQFTSANAGTLTPPGVAAQPFVINDANIATDFANPVIALIGLQPNSTPGEGTYIDYAGISITGVQDGNEVENFVTDAAMGVTSINQSGLWDITDSVNATAVQLVNPTNTPLWLYWTLPDINFGLAVTPLLPVLAANFGNNFGNVAGFVLPGQYSGYLAAPTNTSRAGGTNWDLVPASCFPSAEYPNLTNAYFSLTDPVPPN
jgi:hypothetical protein